MQLMDDNLEYAQMFRRQAENYIAKSIIDGGIICSQQLTY